MCGGALPLADGTAVAAVCAGGKCRRKTETVLAFVADHKVGDVMLTENVKIIQQIRCTYTEHQKNRRYSRVTHYRNSRRIGEILKTKFAI